MGEEERAALPGSLAVPLMSGGGRRLRSRAPASGLSLLWGFGGCERAAAGCSAAARREVGRGEVPKCDFHPVPGLVTEDRFALSPEPL